MYAVIKTGGKQYRVQPGDVLVVDKLAGEPGDSVNFGEVLMLGDGDQITLGAPLVDGAAVAATLIETRKGEKIKVFKKIRRQGYRRTQGHRQFESVLRVTGVSGDGRDAKWDGKVDLTPKAVLDARARGLTHVVNSLTAVQTASAGGAAGLPADVSVDTFVLDESLLDGGPSPVVHATVVEHAGPAVEADAAIEAKPKRARAKKPAADASTTDGGEQA